MYVGIASQQDFFLYVPLLQERETDSLISCIPHESVERVLDKGDASLVELSTWTKIILPALTIYTHACGEEGELQFLS